MRLQVQTRSLNWHRRNEGWQIDGEYKGPRLPKHVRQWIAETRKENNSEVRVIRHDEPEFIKCH